MRLLRLDLIAFGPFAGQRLTLGGGPGTLELVYGPNEAGKSTTLRAISDVLFGIPERTRDAHRHAPSEMRLGALVQGKSGAELAFVRRKGRKASLLAADGTPLDEARLAPMLQGATRELFESLFGFDHVRLRESAKALLTGKGNVGESLFAAGAGGRGIHRLATDLAREAEELFVPRARERKVSKAIVEVREARDDLRNALTSPTKYLEQERALGDAIRSRDALRSRRNELSAEQARLTRAVTVLPGLRRRQELLERIAELGPVVLLAPDSAERRAEATRDIAEAEREAARDTERAAVIEERLSRLVAPEALLDVDDALLADLRDRRGSHLSAQIDRPKLVSSAAAVEASVEKALEATGAHRTAAGLTITAAGTARIRSLGQRRQRLEDRLNDALARLAEVKARKAHLVQRLLAPAGADERDTVRATLSTPGAVAAPSPEVVEHFAAEAAEHAAERGRLLRTAEGARDRVRDVERRLFALRREGDVPTESDLLASRSERHGRWREIRGALARGAPPGDALLSQHEVLAEAADTIADRLRREADRVALLASLESEERTATEERSDVERRLAAEDAAIVAFDQRWRDAFRGVGFVPRSPVEMKAWARDFETALSLEPEVARLEAEVLRGREDLSAWRAAWGEASALLGLTAEATEDEAYAVLDAMAQVVRQVEKADGLRKRIEGIDRDAARFAEDVEARCRRYLPEAAGLPAAEAAERLVRAAEKARVDRAERDRLEAELSAVRRSIGTRVADRRDAETRLGALMAAARAGSAAELEEAERRSREASSLRQQLLSVEEELVRAGDRASIEALEEETRGLDLDRARAGLKDLDTELEELAEKMEQASEDAGHLDHGVHSMAHTNAADAAALLEARVASLKRHVRRYVRVRLASVILSREIERYREENQGPLLTRANELLPVLTVGAYAGIRAGVGESGDAVLVAVRADGQVVGVDGLSDGTRDQLYLALRLASLERYALLNEPMPLVLDDVLIHSDDARAEAALRVLGEISRTTQVLFFTHHARLVELARRALEPGRLVEHRLPAARGD